MPRQALRHVRGR